jgi:universal stress protein A
MKLKKILVPTDCSEQSAKAIQEAVALARLSGGSVDLLHVTPAAGGYYPLDRWIWGKEGKEHRLDARVNEVARERFDAFITALPDDVRDAIVTRMETGVAYEVIVRVAQDDNYDLIVMSTHGRTGVKHVMLGSVAERVLRLAKCPVLTIR